MGTVATLMPNARQSGETFVSPLMIVRRWVSFGLLPNRTEETDFSLRWRTVADDDGSILIWQKFTAEPAFCILPEDDCFIVLICAPDDMGELGLFASVEDALNGITQWLSMPTLADYVAKTAAAC